MNVTYLVPQERANALERNSISYDIFNDAYIMVFGHRELTLISVRMRHILFRLSRHYVYSK